MTVGSLALAFVVSAGVLGCDLRVDDEGVRRAQDPPAPAATGAPLGATPIVPITPTPLTPTLRPPLGAPKVDAGRALVRVDAGGPDAGRAVTVVDAGGGKTPPTPTPPTTPPPPPPPPANGNGSSTLLQVNPIDGKCPAGFVLSGPACRRPCNTDAECPKGTFCVSNGRRTCSATK